MPFESDQFHTGLVVSPGNFEFGVQGWSPGQPIPKSITFFLDGSAMICDQHGRPIKCSVIGDKEVRFADSPPEGNHDGLVPPRPQFATHAQVIAALTSEGINWLSYQVRWTPKSGGSRVKHGLTLEAAVKTQSTLVSDGNANVIVAREIACAGWPQLPYSELKKLPLSVLPPSSVDRSSHESYMEDLRKIPDPSLRVDAMRFRKEMYESCLKEMVVEEV